MKQLLKQKKEILLYLIVGVLTTVINGGIYWICYHCCSVQNVPSTVIAWIIAVFFAFWANKWFVFSSKELKLKTVLFEMVSFFGCRLGTGVIDVVIMYLSVDCLHWYPLLMKLISDFIATVINYVASKFFIFSKKYQGQKEA